MVGLVSCAYTQCCVSVKVLCVVLGPGNSDMALGLECDVRLSAVSESKDMVGGVIRSRVPPVPQGLPRYLVGVSGHEAGGNLQAGTLRST